MKLPRNSAVTGISKAEDGSTDDEQIDPSRQKLVQSKIKPSAPSVKFQTGPSTSHVAHADLSHQIGGAHFALGLIHQQNGNLVQARNCFLNSLFVQDPHPGSEHKLIEVHRQIVQHDRAGEIGDLDRDSILFALGASEDKLAMKKYLAELSLREGDFYAGLEQVVECAGSDINLRRQILREISANLFTDAPPPTHPNRLFLNIWRALPSPVNRGKQRIVEWLRSSDEIPGDFVHVGDGDEVLRAALERVQLGKSLGFFVRQLIFGLRSAIELVVFVLESGDASTEEIVSNLFEISESQAKDVELAGLLKIQEFCEQALAIRERDSGRVLFGHLLQMSDPTAMSLAFLTIETITAFCRRMIKESGRNSDSGWLTDVAELIENILVYEKKPLPEATISQMVSPLFQCLLEGITPSVLRKGVHFAGRLAPFLKDDAGGSLVLRSLVETRPDFVRLCEREAQGNLFG